MSRYSEAGVSIKSGNALVKLIEELAKPTHDENVRNGVRRILLTVSTTL
jgi:phosphoribosylaminoimidazole (AIR) synthetase